MSVEKYRKNILLEGAGKMLTIILALTMPFVMMLFFTRVSYSKVGALLVALMVLVFAFNGLEKPVYIIIIAIFSVVAGYVASMKIEKKNKGV